nr:MAG TPA: hypothetical protein [Caudoviricetes sp.]
MIRPSSVTLPVKYSRVRRSSTTSFWERLRF